MNGSASLAKYAPRASDYTATTPWRVVSHTEGLQYVATGLSGVNPLEISHLRIRVNLDMSDATLARSNAVKRFFKALREYQICTHLDLQHCQLTDHTCRVHLGPMLQVNKKITSLDLGSNSFTDKGAEVLFTAFAQSSIDVVKMSSNNITHSCISALVKVMQSFPDKFTEVDFSHTEIGSQGVKSLLPGLEACNKFSVLNLENAKIGDEGCLQIASSLSKLRALTSLLVPENHIGRQGIEQLMKSIEAVTQVLDVSKNYFGDQGFKFVEEMVLSNDKLQTLKIKQIGITLPRFKTFCEKLLERYNHEFGPYPDLKTLELSNNGLGDDFRLLLDCLSHRNCTIQAIAYDTNEVTNLGAKRLKEWMRDEVTDRKKYPKVVGKPGEEEWVNYVNTRRNDFQKLTLKGNMIDADGAEHLADLVNMNPHFVELDLRKNPIGVKGAIWFKKAFRKLQCSRKSFDKVPKTFKFHILPADITTEGVNHLAIGIREHPETIKNLVKSVGNSESNKKYHTYVRSETRKLQWQKASTINRELEVRAARQNQNFEEEVILGAHKLYDAKALNVKPAASEEKVPENQKDGEPKPPTERVDIVDNTLRHHLGTVATRFKEFDTPKTGGDFKWGVHLYGENDEKEDEWKNLSECTYMSCGIVENDRGVFMWSSSLISAVKNGWGCVLANTLYRYSLLLRFQYLAETKDFIWDTYLDRYNKGNGIAFMKKMINLNDQEALIDRLVADDLESFWDGIMHQSNTSTESLTMFELMLKKAESPVIDVLRQFINVFPAQAFATKSHKRPAVFLQQEIANSSLTYRDLCLKSRDKFVRRYAQAKKLVLFRFMEVEPVYISSHVKVTKVEDLLLTEEYDDKDRFFYMRRVAGSAQANEENLAKNELEAHQSFTDVNFSYLDSDNLLFPEKIENIILKRVNGTLDADFIPQISQLFHRKQRLNDDRLMPTFTVMWKTTLREVLDNESLAGGRDLCRAQIMLKMIANSLFHFNSKDWLQVFGENVKLNPLAKQARIHGHVKPRNIVLREKDEMPDLDKDIGYLPGKWVLADFTRSTKHGDDYWGAKNSAYNPPEVAKRLLTAKSERHFQDRIPANEKMDVWQFGCVLFEVLSGTTLFKMEGNTDLIVDDEQRGELVNWTSLDEERSNLILNQLRCHQSQYSGTSAFSSNIAMSLNNWGGYDDEMIENIIKTGRHLVQWCLQGRPEDRPSFSEILSHPFLSAVDIGRTKLEVEADKILGVHKASWDDEEFLKSQPHVHLINTDFEQAGLVVKSLKESLARSGCRITTDSISAVTPEEYQKEVLSNVESARIIACLLTRDAFFKPNVVKQLLHAEGYRKQKAKAHARVLFLDLTRGLDLSKNNLTWNKSEFAKTYFQCDEFQYMVEAIAKENPSLKNFDVKTNNYDDAFAAWKEILGTDFKTMVQSYLQDAIAYEPVEFMKTPMVDRMLVDAHLVPTCNLKPLEAGDMGSNNFKDKADVLNKKLEDRKSKFMNLYFLPSNKVKTGTIRTYVLCADNKDDETFNAVSEIARALEAPSSETLLPSEQRHKEDTDPRNRLFNKVKTSKNIKKASHLKVGGRQTALQNVRDNVMNITRKEGALLVILYVTKGVFKRYSSFLNEACAKRGDSGFSCVFVTGVGLKIDQDFKDEVQEFCPEALRSAALNKDSYIPYHKPKKEPWQYEAAMKRLVTVAAHKVVHPTPKESF